MQPNMPMPPNKSSGPFVPQWRQYPPAPLRASPRRLGRLWIWLVLIGVVVVGGGKAGILAYRHYYGDVLPPRPPESAEQKYEQAVAAFNSPPVAADDPRVAGIAATLERFRQAVLNNSSSALVDCFDLPRMVAEIRRLDPERIPGSEAERNDMIAGARAGLSRGMLGAPVRYRWTRVQVHLARFSDDRSEAVVYSRERLELAGTSAQSRWWLRLGGDGTWYIYDQEGLDVGIRLSTGLAMIVSQRGRPGAYKEIQDLKKAMEAMGRLDVDGCEAELARIDPKSLPKPIRALVPLLRASLRVGQERYAEALPHLDEVERLKDDTPLVLLLRARALVGLERWEESLAQVRRYEAMLGPDEETCAMAGEALIALGRPDEAANAFRIGLQDNPESEELKAALATVVPATGPASRP